VNISFFLNIFSYIEVFRSTYETMKIYSTLSDSNITSEKILNNQSSLKRKSSSSSSTSSNCLIETSNNLLSDYDSANMQNKRHKSQVKHETHDYLAYIENAKSLPSLMSKNIEAPADLTLKSEPVIRRVSLLDLDVKVPANILNEQQQKIEFQFGVRMRGLPYSAGERDVRSFFSPLQPIKIELLMGKYGECECYFQSSKEVDEAMKYHKKYMSNRYIELFKMPSGVLSLPTIEKGCSSNKTKYSTRGSKKEKKSNRDERQNNKNKQTEAKKAKLSADHRSNMLLPNRLSPIQQPSHLAEQLSTPIKQEFTRNIYENSFFDSIYKAKSTPILASPLNSNQFRTHAPLNLNFDLHTYMKNKFLLDLLALYSLQQNPHPQTPKHKQK
jgi:hypothetical protein